ncbi:O-antigen ligase family protein [Peribacillus simplex]|uniref:O-antigen ligase family protein n=1 Tax=Peribacillus simplex TaxID=1478 RepID=UPI002E1E82F7|nr:O-antigen ligase family protein [Peribacillus simplex]
MISTRARKVANILYVYILLTAIPFFLVKFPIFSFIAPGTILYSIYIYFLYLLLPFILLKLNNFRFYISKNQFLLMYFIVLLYFVSFFAGIYYYPSYSLLVKTLLISVGIFTFIGVPSSFVLTEEEVKSFMKKIVYFVVFASIYNVLINHDLLLYGTSSLELPKQFASFFSNRNTYAIILVLGIIACTFLIVLEKKMRYIIFSLLFFISMIWTDSTNSLMSTIIFLVFFILFYYKKNNIKMILFVFTGVGLLSILYIKGFLDGIIAFVKYGDLSEFSGRTDIWMAGLNTLKESIFFGVGIGQSKNVLSSNDFNFDQFHNGYLEILVSGGVILFIVYIVLGIYMVINLRRLYSIHKLIGSIYLASFFSLIFSMFFESIVFFHEGFFSGIVTIFYLFIPLTLLNHYIKPKKEFSE